MVTNVTVFLYQNSKSDNFNRIKKITGLTTEEKLQNQNTYFDGLNKIRVDGTFNKFGEKILLNGSLNYFLNCNYGRFEYYGKYYYFSITDFEVCNDSKTYMIYRFDYYETARFQYGLTFGKGTVIRGTLDYGVIRHKPPSEDGLGERTLSKIKTYNNIYGILVYVWDSTNDRGDVFLMRNNPNINVTLYHTVIHGLYLKGLKDIGAISTYKDIKGCWIIPYGFLNDDPTNNGFERYNQSTYIFKMSSTPYSVPIQGTLQDFDNDHKITLSRTRTSYSIVKDSRNITIWEFPRGYVGSYQIVPRWVLNISPISATFKIYLDGFETQNEYCNEYFFTYNCDTLPVFNDTFDEYAYRQRDYDIRNRQIQNEQQTLNSLLNVGTSVISGGIAGGSVGMTGYGAVGGAISGTVSAVGSYFINDYFGNQIQKATDKLYKRAEDQLILQGDGLNQFTEKGEWGFCTVVYTGDYGYDLIDETIRTYGDEINVSSRHINDYIEQINSRQINDYVSGDFEILGNFPSVWKRQIQDRFKQGVSFDV